MGKSSLPKYTGEGPSNKYFDITSSPYTSNSSYDNPDSASNYQSRLFSYLGRLSNSMNMGYKSLDDKIKPYNLSLSALADVCPTCQRPLFTDKPVYMDLTRRRKAA